MRGESDGGFIRSADLWGHLVRKCKCFLSAIFFVGSSCQPDEHLKPLHPLFFFFFPFPFSKKQQFLGWTCVLQRTWPASLLYRRGSGPDTPVVVSFPAFGLSASSLTTRIYLPFQLLACQWRRDSLPCRLPDHVHLTACQSQSSLFSRAPDATLCRQAQPPSPILRWWPRPAG